MIHITSLDDGLELFKALGSDIRIQILKILLENNQMSMNQLANELNISNGALTGHIKKLEECGLISTSNDSSGHGNQKLCSLIQDRILVEIEKTNRLKQRIQHLHQGRTVLISQRSAQPVAWLHPLL
jgi:predicted transcriptional regulator